MSKSEETLEEFMKKSMAATDMWVERMKELSEMVRSGKLSEEETEELREKLRERFEDKHDVG